MDLLIIIISAMFVKFSKVSNELTYTMSQKNLYGREFILFGAFINSFSDSSV